MTGSVWGRREQNLTLSLSKGGGLSKRVFADPRGESFSILLLSHEVVRVVVGLVIERTVAL